MGPDVFEMTGPILIFAGSYTKARNRLLLS